MECEAKEGYQCTLREQIGPFLAASNPGIETAQNLLSFYNVAEIGGA